MTRLVHRLVLATVSIAMLATTPAFAFSRVNGVAFSDGTNGVIAGGVTDGRGFISYTDDGGASFHASPERLDDGGRSAGAKALAVPSFLDAGWVSADTGLTWTRREPVIGSYNADFSAGTVFSGGRLAIVEGGARHLAETSR